MLEQYQTRSHTEEALHRSVDAYLELGLVHEAQRHAAILGHNYADSPWYNDTYRLVRRHGQELLEIQALNDATGADDVVELTPEQRLEAAGEDVDLGNAPEALPPEDNVGATTTDLP